MTYTAKQLGKLLGVTAAQVSVWIKDGLIVPTQRDKRSYAIDDEELTRFFDRYQEAKLRKLSVWRERVRAA